MINVYLMRDYLVIIEWLMCYYYAIIVCVLYAYCMIIM